MKAGARLLECDQKRLKTPGGDGRYRNLQCVARVLDYGIEFISEPEALLSKTIALLQLQKNNLLPMQPIKA